MSELRRIYRKRDLHAVTGLKESRIDELIRNGEFPSPIKLTDGGRASGWLESDLAEWQRGRIAARDSQPKRIRVKQSA